MADDKRPSYGAGNRNRRQYIMDEFERQKSKGFESLEEITKDIAQELQRVVPDTDDIEEADPEFVWYENPKIHPELPYHVQVFVKGKKPRDVGAGVGNAPQLKCHFVPFKKYGI